ncbi:hypothetical protein EDB19DRAFT_1834083 [Suillus lakei]|nr:hypothetical protein EDB19DRAFT_1834083 [Suillus lakei]
MATKVFLAWTSRLVKCMWHGHNIAAWIVCKLCNLVEHSSPTYKPGHARTQYLNNSQSGALSNSEAEEWGFNLPVATFVSLAPEILSDTDMTVEDIKATVAAQFATCERLRHRIMSRIWAVEEANRWSHVLDRTMGTLKKEHQAAESRLKVWIDGAQRGCIEVSSPSSSTTKHMHKEKETYMSVQSHYDKLERLLIDHGVTDPYLCMGGDDDDENSKSGCA